MIEVYGDLWTYDCDVICVTTNNVIKQNGEAVMGSGVAWDAKKRFPSIPRVLAKHLQAEGNVPAILYMNSTPWLVSFPTKDHWREPSRMDLIVQSAHALVKDGRRKRLGAHSPTTTGLRQWTTPMVGREKDAGASSR